MIDRALIIQAVFERYGIVLGDDDPILLSSMTQEAILEQMLTQIDTAMQGVMVQLDLLGQGYTEQGRTEITQTTKQMTVQLKETLEQTMRHEAVQAVNQIHQAHNHLIKAIERRVEELHGLRDWSLCSAGGAVLLFLCTAFLTWLNV